MFKNIGKDYKFGKRTENMKRRSQVFSNNFEKTYDKIEKTENSKFRDVTSAEIKKLIFMCKSEQNIINWNWILAKWQIKFKDLNLTNHLKMWKMKNIDKHFYNVLFIVIIYMLYQWPMCPSLVGLDRYLHCENKTH